MSPKRHEMAHNVADVPPNSFGAQLRRLREEAGLSQGELGEALALTWDDVDLAQRTVRVRRTITRDANEREIVGTQPKTASSRRDVSLFAETVAHLERHRTEQKVRRLQCGPLWQDRNLVFDAGDGSLLTRGKAYLKFTAAVQAAGLRKLTPHGCRHTMAVTWLRAGKSPKVVSERLGHKSAAFTLDVYARVSPDWQRSDTDDVEAFIQRAG